MIRIETLSETDITLWPLNWVSSGDKEQPIVIAIHGTPGDGAAWRQVASQPKIKAHFHFIAIDRPGWGQSSIQTNYCLPRFSEQAKVIMNGLARLIEAHTHPIILLGHSWGGPVVMRLLMDYPTHFSAAILVASPFNPILSQPRWYHRLADLNWVQPFIGTSLRRSNQEMLSLAHELHYLQEGFSDITQPIAILQGKKDWLVHWQHAHYLNQQLVKASVTLYEYPKLNHFIPYQQPHLIDKALWELYHSL